MSKEYIRVPYGSTVHGDEEIEAVVNVLKTSTQMSSKTEEFETKVSKLFSKEYGLMVNSGSSALYVGIESLGLKPQSEVITPALTFATTVGCLVKNSLVPAFVDVSPDTYCINTELILEKITDKTKAILAMLEPITFPKVISVCPFMAACKLTKSSGAEVAKDTIVIPATSVDIFSFKARDTEPFTKASPPK